MAKVQLEIPETQVIELVQQLSPQGKQVVWQMLVAAMEGPDDLEIMDDEELIAFWEEEDEEWDDDYPCMGLRELMAAETFQYSYANYDDHLGIGNVRFDKLMPDDVETLAQAEMEGWDDERLALALEIEVDKVPVWRESYQRAKEIVMAPSPAESFRRGVRYSILDAVEEGLGDERSINKLVTQICYRAADLGYLLDMEEELLSYYSEELRQETDDDAVCDPG